MAQYQLTVNEETLQNLLSGDGESLAKLLEELLNQVLEAQRTEQLQADNYERTDGRQGYRNGYKPRKMNTRVGTLNLRVPQIREGVFSTELFSRYQRSEQALVLTLMEMVVNGVSTRKVTEITEELCGTQFSASTVSDLCKRLDPKVTAWNERDLSETTYPFLIVDALVLRIREGGRIRQHSMLIVTGVNADGYREILGVQIGNSETQESWSKLFRWLKGRGLSGVEYVVSDDHSGLVNAIQTEFQGAVWQRCQTHFMRNILDACPKRLQKSLHGRLRSLFEAPDFPTAEQLLQDILRDFSDAAPKAMETLEQGFLDAVAVLHLPEKYRRRLRTTNSVERLNEEIRRRERVIRIFPNQESAMRLIGALLLEQHEVWSTGRLYFNMNEFWEWKREQELEKEDTSKNQKLGVA